MFVYRQCKWGWQWFWRLGRKSLFILNWESRYVLMLNIRDPVISINQHNPNRTFQTKFVVLLDQWSWNAKNCTHIIEPILLAQELYSHLQLLWTQSSVLLKLWILEGLSQSELGFIMCNCGFQKCQIWFGVVLLVLFGQNLWHEVSALPFVFHYCWEFNSVNYTYRLKSVQRFKIVHPFRDSSTVVQVHLLKGLGKVLIGYCLKS